MSRHSVVSREPRLRHGKAQRKHLSRSQLSSLGARSRSFDPIQLLVDSNEGRLPKLLPLKYKRMSASPFAFFRGALAIMVADLAAAPHSHLTVELCGDAHLQNLGYFAAPDARLVFDINDFDETAPGPWEWDAKRMATSIVLAGAESGHGAAGNTAAVEAFVASYCSLLEELAEQPILVAARHAIHRVEKAKPISAALRQAERATPAELFHKYAYRRANGEGRFKEQKPVLWRLRGRERRQVLDALPLYRKSLAADRAHLFDFFRTQDVAFKVVGTGSVGLRDFVILMEGNGREDPLFLQLKQEVPSAYAPYLAEARHTHQGQRVAEGQRKIQPLSDLLLGWTRFAGHDYLVRQLNDHKGAVELAQLKGGGLSDVSAIAGELLARGHARSGDALAIKGYLGAGGKALKAIEKFAFRYAEQTVADFELFQKAIRDGRIQIAE